MLWLLHPRPDVLSRPVHPWTPQWDKVLGLVVRAQDEAEARAFAQAQAGHEGAGIYRGLGAEEEGLAMDVWLDPKWTTCVELEASGPAGVILIDRYEA
jgi:hypothetical protein